MPDSPPEKTIERSTASPVQLSFPIAPQACEEIALLLQEGEEQWEIVVSEPKSATLGKTVARTGIIWLIETAASGSRCKQN